MAAPKGNKFWLQRASSGRELTFSSPEELLKSCLEYFNDVENNPLYESKLISYQGKGTLEDVPKMRAMTITGLCIFLNIIPNTWYTYAKRDDFKDIISQVESIIRTQKFEGASADLLNANIIARDLGLVDKNEHSGPDGGPIESKWTVEIVKANVEEEKKDEES